LSVYLNDGLLAGIRPERRGNQDFDGHFLPFKTVLICDAFVLLNEFEKFIYKVLGFFLIQQ
jgi:hypothetical protein